MKYVILSLLLSSVTYASSGQKPSFHTDVNDQKVINAILAEPLVSSFFAEANGQKIKSIYSADKLIDIYKVSSDSCDVYVEVKEELVGHLKGHPELDIYELKANAEKATLLCTNSQDDAVSWYNKSDDEKTILSSYKVKDVLGDNLSKVQITNSKSDSDLYYVQQNSCVLSVVVKTEIAYPVIDSNEGAYKIRLVQDIIPERDLKCMGALLK